jgi:hypothetical protein
MYSVWHNYMFILLLFYYWLLVSSSKDHPQANIYKKKLKMLVHRVQKRPIKLTFLYYMHQHFTFFVNIGLMMVF